MISQGQSLGRIAVCAGAIAATISWSAISEAETIPIQAKSYIASVNLLDPDQFDSDAASCQAAMAALVNCGTLNENPADGTKTSGDFRLWSQVLVDARCDGDLVSNWQFKPVEKDFGSEFVIFATSGDLAKPLAVVPSSQGSEPMDSISFNWRLRGQPNSAGVAVMNAVKPRTCSYIWHQVAGTLSCRSGQPIVRANIIGSQFPSHRLWVQGQKVADVQQGPFKKLWQCSPDDPLSVQ